MSKICERCEKKIPSEYVNLLCDECYALVSKEREEREANIKTQLQSEIQKNPQAPTNEANLKVDVPVSGENTPPEAPESPTTNVTCDHSTCGISDPNYRENPEMSDKDQILANLAQFIYTHRDKDHEKGRKNGVLLYYPQRNMYTFIKNYCIKKAMAHPQYPKYLWKPKIVDVGCGSGVGSNLLSQEADFVWGIDKNAFSIEFAKEAFTREKNGIYYTPQVTFDEVDVMTDTREFMAFDIVVAIEVIEHIWDVHQFLNQIKRFTMKDKRGNIIKSFGTEFFLSTPNRNSPKIRKDRPENIFHVREWTSDEIHALLEKHFENVEMLNQKGESIPIHNEEQVVFLKCSIPK